MARPGNPVRRRLLALAVSLASLALLTASGPGAALAAPQSDVGAKVAMKTALTTLPPGRVIAVLFLRGKDQTSQAVCVEYFRRYSYSLGHPEEYDRFVYFIKDPGYAAPVTGCADFRKAYNANVWPLASNDLQLERLGEAAGPLLVLVKGVSPGHYANMGYVNFYGATTPEAVKSKFDKFHAYFLCPANKWGQNKEIDHKTNGVMDLVEDWLPFLGPAC